MARRPRSDPARSANASVEPAASGVLDDAPPTLDEVRRVMSALGKLGGPKGGKARAAKLSGKRRSAIAKRAAIARWSAGTKD
jgi:hypothetical protein